MSDENTDELADRVEQLDEQAIRKIAQEEAREIYDIEVEDGNGENWSLIELVDTFGIKRRTALKAMGLMAVGSSATVAVLQSISGEAEAAVGSAGQIGTDADRPTIKADDIDANSVSTDKTATTGVTWQNVSRSFDNWEQAPTDRDIIFTMNAVANADNTFIDLKVHINESQNDLVIVTYDDASVGQFRRLGTGAFRVPAGHYYKIEAAGDTADYSIQQWSELR